MRHIGVNGQSHCGASYLLNEATTMDIQQADCVDCLWKVLQEAFRGIDIIALRIKVVTDERAALFGEKRVRQ